MDIVSWCSVPRYLHNDLPLGNPLGPPYNKEAQRQSIETAIDMIEAMDKPGIHVSDLSWPEGESWKPVYGEVTESTREKLLEIGRENRARRTTDKSRGLAR